jgi:hypothetical protein
VTAFALHPPHALIQDSLAADAHAIAQRLHPDVEHARQVAAAAHSRSQQAHDTLRTATSRLEEHWIAELGPRVALTNEPEAVICRLDDQIARTRDLLDTTHTTLDHLAREQAARVAVGASDRVADASSSRGPGAGSGKHGQDRVPDRRYAGPTADRRSRVAERRGTAEEERRHAAHVRRELDQEHHNVTSSRRRGPTPGRGVSR